MQNLYRLFRKNNKIWSREAVLPGNNKKFIFFNSPDQKHSHINVQLSNLYQCCCTSLPSFEPYCLAHSLESECDDDTECMESHEFEGRT